MPLGNYKIDALSQSISLILTGFKKTIKTHKQMTASRRKYTGTDKLVTTITAWLATMALLVIAGWGSMTVWRSWRYQETNDAQVDEYINPVTCRVTGYIKKIYYQENQAVKEGDTLVVIEDNEYKIHRAEAEAALASAKAQVQVLESNIKTAGKEAQVNLAQIDAVKAKLWHQQQEYARFQQLVATASVTQQQFENIKAAMEIAQGEYRTIRNTYAAAAAKVEDIQSQKAVALAEVSRREALLDKANLDVTYTIIRAPYDGKVGKKMIQLGQLVQAGQTLAFIVDLEEGKWVVANYKETQIKEMYVGENVEVAVDALPGEQFHGQVASLSPATGSRFSLLPPDNATGNFVKIVQRIPVRIKLTDEPAKLIPLRAGMNATVIIKNKG
jgi:membrane fusion protein (multidrug efflux system)